MEMSTILSSATSMDVPTTTSSSFSMTTTDFTPGQIDSKGVYVPTDDEVTAYQAARVPWAAQVKYGYYTLGFLCGVLIIFTLLQLIWKVRTRYNPRIPFYKPLAAALRLLTYPRLPVSSWLGLLWTIGPLGPNILLFGGLLFSSCLTWINRYYYYAPFYGSSPLYLRSEWIAMATLPFVYVLGSKRNIISILTGVSHEKLQVLHQGAAFNFVYMSLVHTITAIIRAYRDYGFPLELQYDSDYASGFVALAPLCVLFIGALPPFRKAFYEAFYGVHIVMALLFLGAMFWHGYRLLDSNSYMIATVVLFFFGVLYRLVAILLGNPFLHSATAALVDDNIIQLSIPTTAIDWGPGQHIFLRFLSVRPLESHPFSFATIPSTAATVRTMQFAIRGRGGFTKALSDHIKRTGQTNFAVLADGPYGGVGQDFRAFDSVLFCGGGTGITWALTCLQDLVQGVDVRRQDILLIWAVPYTRDLSWFETELKTISGSHHHIKVEIYVTREAVDASESESIPKRSSTNQSAEVKETETPGEQSEGKAFHLSSMRLLHERPTLPAIIMGHIRRSQGSVAIASCGPPSFIIDCANTVTRAQMLLMKGEFPDVSEVYLKSETFEW